MTDARVIVTAPAKINLNLHVGGRRADGYHDLESLVAFVAYGDEIALVEPHDALSLSVMGPFGADLSAGEDNLALRAARFLAKEITRAGVRIALKKNVPVASGLGGGSADAAAVLRGLVKLWHLDLDREALRDIAESLGADVPVCIDSAPAWMEGRGERVRLLPPFPEAHLLLVNPGVPVPTAQVFAALRERSGLGASVPERFEDLSALVRYLKATKNDLESPARAIAPVIGTVLEALQQLPGALLARMSGSGATCFALFADEAAARSAGQILHAEHPQWWCVDTAFARGSL